ncbi:dipeptidase [Mycoplasmatota bacterium zrk1]
MKMIDLHCDTILKLLFNKEKGILNKNDFHVDLNKLKESNSYLQTFAIFASPEFCEREDVKANNQHELVLEMYDRFMEEVEIHKDEIAIVKEFSDISRNSKDSKISGLLAIEGAGSVDGKLERFQEYYDMGVRLITITWNYVNSLGYPNVPKENMSKGLTDFGIKAIAKMNELGMIIDVSHLSDAGFWDVVKYSTKPFVASHSNARSIGHHVRNLTDDMIKALSLKGGVTGINFCSAFLTEDTKSKEMYVRDLVKNIKHIKEVGGIDCIALGTDFDGIDGILEIRNISEMDKLISALKDEGFTKEEIEKIWYKNALRVLKDIL